jgi:hypothetical protein
MLNEIEFVDGGRHLPVVARAFRRHTRAHRRTRGQRVRGWHRPDLLRAVARNYVQRAPLASRRWRPAHPGHRRPAERGRGLHQLEEAGRARRLAWMPFGRKALPFCPDWISKTDRFVVGGNQLVPAHSGDGGGVDVREATIVHQRSERVSPLCGQGWPTRSSSC